MKERVGGWEGVAGWREVDMKVGRGVPWGSCTGPCPRCLPRAARRMGSPV